LALGDAGDADSLRAAMRGISKVAVILVTCRISSYHGLLGNSFRGALC
jgi:hypothetical protein